MNKRRKSTIVIILCLVFMSITVSGSIINIPEEEDIVIPYDPSRTQSELYILKDAGHSVELTETIDEALIYYNDAVKGALLPYYSDAEIDLKYQLTSAQVNSDVYFQYGIIVKGSSISGKPDMSWAVPSLQALQTQDADGDWRFLGQNVNDEWVENPFFDPTLSAGSDIDKRDWLYWDDYTNILSSVIGDAVVTDGIYCHEDIVEDLYLNYVYGFANDYGAYASPDYTYELGYSETLYSQNFVRLLFTIFNPNGADAIFHQVGTGGTSHPPKGSTEMGSYIRIVSLPSEHSAGVAYLFHQTASGTVYYASVFLYDTAFAPPNFAEAQINAPTTISDTESSTSGTFDFNFGSLRGEEWASYEITSVTGNVTINPADMTGTIAGGNVYNGSIPITISVSGSSETVSIEVKGTTDSGNTVVADDDHTVTKVISGSAVTSTSMDANGSGVLNSDDRGSEEFDVLQGIPTTEDLYVNVFADEYLYEELYTPITGTKTYTVTVKKTYHKTWTDPILGTQTDDDTRTNTYTVTKNYTYYIIDQLDVFELSETTVYSDTLSGGSLTLSPSGYTAPVLNVTQHTDHIDDPYPSGTHTVTLPDGNISGGTSEPATPDPDWSSTADSSVALLVRNDLVEYDGTIPMSDVWTETIAPAPPGIAAAPQIGNNVLYKDDLTIPIGTLNGTHISSGTVTYTRNANSVNSAYGSTLSQPLASINDVIVHSPVVCYPDIPFDFSINQVIDRDDTKPNAVIEQNFTVNYPNSGQHRSITGYGNRNYQSYISSKEIQAGCDLYLMNGDVVTDYIPSGTWYVLPTTLETFELRIPHWVSEADYQILFRTFANNTPAAYSGMFQVNQNSSVVNYYAIDVIDIAVVGQMYDLRITGTTESNYDNIFFDSTGGNTGVEYFVGDEDRYGNVDITHVNTLPIIPGKNANAGFDNHVLKKGAAFFFSVKTNGNMTETDDFVVAVPSYWYVDYNGLNRQQVDIWYETNNGLYRSIEYPYDIETSVNNKYTNLSDTDLNNTATQYFTDFYSGTRTASNYQTWFREDDSKLVKKIGDSTVLALDYEQKLYIGDTGIPAGVSYTDAVKGTQEYTGAFFIPRTARALPMGDNDLNNELKNGYLIVNLDFYTIDGFTGNPIDYHLAYETGAANMYMIENYLFTQGAFSFSSGDLVFYDLNKSSDEDFTTQGIY